MKNTRTDRANTDHPHQPPATAQKVSAPAGSLGLVKIADELLSRAERRRTATLAEIAEAKQLALGQYFTPDRPARLVAALPRATMRKFLSDLAWETEVWNADEPTHLIHLSGSRLTGPYESSVSV